MIKFKDVYSVPGAVDLLWALMLTRSREEDQHTNISHRQMPTFEQHLEFVRSKPYYLWFLIFVPDPDLDKYIGSINVTERNEIGIVLCPEYRGRGFGRDAVHHLLQVYPPLPAIPSKRPGHFVANINPKNEASIRLFTSLGGVHISNTYKL